MANIDGVRSTTIPFAGSAVVCPVVLENNKASFVSIYAQTGDCVVSFGQDTANHATNAVTIAEGKWLETRVPPGQVNYTGAATALLVIQDSSSKCMVTSDGRPLTYDGGYLFYDNNFKLSTPTFT